VACCQQRLIGVAFRRRSDSLNHAGKKKASGNLLALGEHTEMVRFQAWQELAFFHRARSRGNFFAKIAFNNRAGRPEVSMNPHFTNLELIAIAIAVVLMIGAFALLYAQKRRAATADLREKFGSEYERAVQKQGSPRAGEAKLLDREKRVEKLNIHELEPAERVRFLEQWQTVQSHFVDSPAAAVTQADELVTSLLQSRGYPVSDFEQRAADISVDHPKVTENYRAAHAIALRSGKSETSTEDLRTAMIDYRSLFEELAQAGAPDKKIAA
jgi:hypothetical protein